MEGYVLRTNNLTKRFKKATALNDVSVFLEQGKIYGIIGQNGAGKSTLMKLISGVSYPTSGDIELFEKKGKKELLKQRKRVGCMIESPSIIYNMTARENLRFHRIMRGIPDKKVEAELLELVGLTDTGEKKARDFSLGMKQRLGIAITLIGNSEFLILDEPINGLDPRGVVDIRILLKKICEEKQITILISSHNLPELYQTATDYIILHKGEIKKVLTLKELEKNCNRHISIRTNQLEKLVTVLESDLQTNNYKIMQDKSIMLFDYIDDEEKVANTLFQNGIIVTKFCNEGETLEDYFLSVIGGAPNA